jgi:hypothetical protein
MFFRLGFQCIHSREVAGQQKSHRAFSTGCDFAVNYEL